MVLLDRHIVIIEHGWIIIVKFKNNYCLSSNSKYLLCYAPIIEIQLYYK